MFSKGATTVLVLKIAHWICKETKQQPGTAGPGNMLGCCLNSFHFLWAILSTSTVQIINYHFIAADIHVDHRLFTTSTDLTHTDLTLSNLFNHDFVEWGGAYFKTFGTLGTGGKIVIDVKEQRLLRRENGCSTQKMFPLFWTFHSNRSVQVFYPKSDVQNANIRWYWTVDNHWTPGDMIHDLTRPTVDGNILDDYVLLKKCRMGRHLTVLTATGDMAIAEILMTFAGMRKSRVQSDVGPELGKITFLLIKIKDQDHHLWSRSP